jgi:hypothetical protein
MNLAGPDHGPGAIASVLLEFRFWHFSDFARVRNAHQSGRPLTLRIYGFTPGQFGERTAERRPVARRNYFPAFILLNFTLFPSACRVAI